MRLHHVDDGMDGGLQAMHPWSSMNIISCLNSTYINDDTPLQSHAHVMMSLFFQELWLTAQSWWGVHGVWVWGVGVGGVGVGVWVWGRGEFAGTNPC